MSRANVDFVFPEETEQRCRPVKIIMSLYRSGKLARWRPDPSDTGDCEESTHDLAVDLVANGHTDFVVARGEILGVGGRVTHMWLEWEGLVLDVSNGGARRGKYLANYADFMFRLWQPQHVERWPADQFVKVITRE